MGAKSATEPLGQARARRAAGPARQPASPAELTPPSVAPAASYAPASPGSVQSSFASIVQRAQRFTSAALNAQAAKASPPPGQQPLAFGAIQRKVSKLTPVATLNQHKSFYFKDEYDAVISEVEDYMNDSKVSATNYGRRMLRLEDIKKKIADWEAKEGKVDAPIERKMITPLADKRRPLLKQLDDSIPVEQDHLEVTGKAASTKAHKNDRAKLTEYLDQAGKSGERMLKNSADWFSVGKAKLYAATPTGDSDARLTKGGMDPDKDEAWFPEGRKSSPGGHILDAEATYNEKSLTDNAGVDLDEGGKVTGGWNKPGIVVITNPSSKPQSTVFETFRHEVQHDADWNKGRDAGEGVNEAGKEFDTTGAGLAPTISGGHKFTGSNAEKNAGRAAYRTQQAEISLTRYKTEYRAYSYQGGPGGQYAALDNSVQNKAHGGKNFTERQLAIFRHIYDGYDYTKENWDADTPLTGGRKFKDEVVKYFNPDTEAFNKYNSPRVDDFYRALDAIGVKEAKTKLEPLMEGRDVSPVEGGNEIGTAHDPGVKNLLHVIERLTAEDATYILNESPAMLTKMGKHLKGEALQAVKDELQEVITPTMLGDIFSLLENVG